MVVEESSKNKRSYGKDGVKYTKNPELKTSRYRECKTLFEKEPYLKNIRISKLKYIKECVTLFLKTLRLQFRI